MNQKRGRVTRRHFLRATAVGIAGTATLSTAASGQECGWENPLRQGTNSQERWGNAGEGAENADDGGHQVGPLAPGPGGEDEPENSDTRAGNSLEGVENADDGGADPCGS